MILDTTRTKPKLTREQMKARQLRAQEKTLRVLKLIDLMASFRQPKSASELLDFIKPDCSVSLMTIKRDLSLLSMLGWVEVGKVSIGKARETLVYKLDVRRTERLQAVAIDAFG